VKHIPPEQQTARLMTERRTKGKLVTVIAGLDPASNDLTELATRLKNACGRITRSTSRYRAASACPCQL
jgi:translation initiation factor 1 (eIF-1/SUI1)